MTVYKGHRVAVRDWYDGKLRVVHLAHNVWADSFDIVRMRCGMSTSVAYATEHITGEPLSCLWCIAGLRRFNTGGFE